MKHKLNPYHSSFNRLNSYEAICPLQLISSIDRAP